MKKTKKMTEKVVEVIEKIYDEDDFLAVMPAALQNDYECEHFLRLVKKYNVQTPDNVLIIIVIICEAGEKTKRKGDYLKDIDTKIEGALLEESTETE